MEIALDMNKKNYEQLIDDNDYFIVENCW